MAGTRDARQRILEAAAELVTVGGLDAATPAAIAERAGAGKMSLYRHFSGKDELVAEALAERDLDLPRVADRRPLRTGHLASGCWPCSIASRVVPIAAGVASSAART